MSLSRDFFASPMGVVALIFSILGATFLLVGAQLAALPGVGQQPHFWPLMLLFNGGLLLVGLLLGARRLLVLSRRERLLKMGISSSATITGVRENPNVRVNRRHPWVVRYRYEVAGEAYEASESVWDLPAGYTLGATVRVVYDASDPSRSALAPVAPPRGRPVI